MDLKVEALTRGFDYLDTHICGEGLVISALAVIVSPAEIGREAKSVLVKSHEIHLGQGNLESAAAALHLAAGVHDGMQKQENTFQRRSELIEGIVSGRRLNIKRSLG